MSLRTREFIKRGIKVANAPEDSLRLTSRLRTLESRHNDLRNRVNFVETNSNESKKSINEDIKEVKNEIRKIENLLEELQHAVEVLRNEVTLRANKEDVDVIRKYFEYINPVKFATHEQVAQIVEEALEKHHKK